MTSGRPIVITPKTVVGADAPAPPNAALQQLALMVLSGLIVSYLSKRL